MYKVAAQATCAGFFFLTGTSVFAQQANQLTYDAFQITYSHDISVGHYIWGINSETGTSTRLTTRTFEGNIYTGGTHIVNGDTSELWIKTGSGNTEAYNWITDTWRTISGSFVGIVPTSTQNPNTDCSQVGNSSSNILICPPTSSKPKAIYIDDNPLIGRASNGAIHIGENSLITIEEDGVQKLYAANAGGNAIPIDITNGTDLLINGKSVQGQIDENRSLIDANTTQINKNIDNINNLAQGVAASTALTSALSSLPTVSEDSPFSCGVGTGGYSSRAAMGLGCAAKLNDRLSFNLGGSYVFGGTYSYGGGSLDTMAARGGFVFKLGKIDDSPKVAAKKAAKLHDLVSKVQDENEAIRSENIEIKTQNQQLQKLLTQQSALLAATQERLERLEQVAGINLSALGDRASR